MRSPKKPEEFPIRIGRRAAGSGWGSGGISASFRRGGGAGRGGGLDVSGGAAGAGGAGEGLRDPDPLGGDRTADVEAGVVAVAALGDDETEVHGVPGDPVAGTGGPPGPVMTVRGG